MSEHDVVIGGRIYMGGELVHVCVGIRDGKIVSIKKALSGDSERDYGERIILPGAIDTHVHLREPGQCHKEDFYTGTMAAAHAGVTCVLDMPNNIPPVTSLSTLIDKHSQVRKKACVDYGLFTALYHIPKGDWDGILRHAAGLKLYLAPTTGNIFLPSVGDAIEALNFGLNSLDIGEKEEAEGDVGNGPKFTITVHCEDAGTIRRRLGSYGDVISTLEDYDNVRDVGGEASSAYALINAMAPLLNTYKGVRLNIAHVTSRSVIETVQSAAENWDLSERLSCEVTPHHIYLNRNYRHPTHHGPGFGKVNPPLRSIDVQRGLWDAIASGQVDIFATDHAPHTVDEKSEPFMEAPAGLPALETGVPMLLYLLRTQNLSLERYLTMVSWNPARIFNIGGKGYIQEGMDADLMVVDFREVKRIKARDLYSKCGWTPYEGMEAIFPQDVYLRGERIVKDWCFVGESGYGRNVNLSG